MPPFIRRKRSLSPKTKTSPPPSKRPTVNKEVIELLDSSDDSSLSDVSSDFTDVLPKRHRIKAESDNDGDSDDDEGEDGVDWEDAIDATPSAPTAPETPLQDLQLTLDPTENTSSLSLLDSKKGPSKIEREIRYETHRVHVQCLLFHNALRNAWLNDSKLHDILRSQIPPGIQKEVQRWRVASALDPPPEPSEDRKSKSGKKRKGKKASGEARDWGDGAVRQEPGQPDMSNGDPILSLLRVLAAYWKKSFKITAPGLRKHGYRPMKVVERLVSSFQKDEHDPRRHGERIRNAHEFRTLADKRQGSRDVGAQLFTALLRALGIEARLVASLQPLGFGWSKSEVDTSDPAEKQDKRDEAASSSEQSDEDEESDETPKKPPSKRKTYDSDLPFPIYWTEVISPITHEVVPVDPVVLSNPVATTPELLAAFEPRGARAEKAKQVIAYVIAHSSDGTAKDVTTRYLKRRTWPGKTKGYRLPIERIVVKASRRNGPEISYDYDWFRMTMKGYVRSEENRTVVDDVEDAKDLVPKQPERKVVKKEGDTLQSLRSSEEFALERFLRREEALRPGAKVVRKFLTGKGDKAKEENVYRRKDIVKCLSAESWHKEGRRPKMGEAPLKRVPIRAVTLNRKREVDEQLRETGQTPMQGLYALHQTELIIPPPIEDGVIPKNEYGNIDCFTPHMIPRGAVHLPWRGTVRVCKKLNIDYAEAVIGFEFGHRMAVPIIQGVVVAAENKDLVEDAWREQQAAQDEKERLQREKRILHTWRKFLMGMRIVERVRTEYGANGDAETHNPFQRRSQPNSSSKASDKHREHRHEDMEADQGGGFLLPENDDDDEGEDNEVDQGGGFLLPGHGEENGQDDLIVESHDNVSSRSYTTVPYGREDDSAVGYEDQEEDDSERSDVEVSSPEEDQENYSPPRPAPRRRRRGG